MRSINWNSLDNKLFVVVAYGDVDGREWLVPLSRILLDGGPDGVLEQLWEDVLEGHLDVGEGGVDVAGDADVGSVAVPLDGQLLGERRPLLDHTFQAQPDADDANVVRLKNVKKSFNWSVTSIIK